ncbi:hypothetical protein GYMLUDRAFT_934571 [Collybiopsis luxurians FD-317 M1]|nr:hypothetical protein GYMLUDRAFT_934571 [Collybiopsis luxurians FD-317 M1]
MSAHSLCRHAFSSSFEDPSFLWTVVSFCHYHSVDAFLHRCTHLILRASIFCCFFLSFTENIKSIVLLYSCSYLYSCHHFRFSSLSFSFFFFFFVSRPSLHLHQMYCFLRHCFTCVCITIHKTPTVCGCTNVTVQKVRIIYLCEGFPL